MDMEEQHSMFFDCDGSPLPNVSAAIPFPVFAKPQAIRQPSQVLSFAEMAVKLM
jgi:hypothetical protein